MGDAEPRASCCEPLSPDQTHARAALPGPRCSGLNVWSGEAAVHASTFPTPCWQPLARLLTLLSPTLVREGADLGPLSPGSRGQA